MKFLITGGTGFIGSALVADLIRQGHSVTLLSRYGRTGSPPPGVERVAWALEPTTAVIEAVSRADVLINLAGEPLVGRRWTPEQKIQIVHSRMRSTHALSEAVRQASHTPAVWVNASAVGFYGPRGDEALTERSPSGAGFLSEVCQIWEREANRLQDVSLAPAGKRGKSSATKPRLVILRFGIVLGTGGGALAQMATPFRLGLGGPLGDGKQWMSWIHLTDLVRLIEFVCKQSEVSGVVNATAPNPVRMEEFARALGRAFKRPALLKVPAPVLKLLLGEMADVLLTGQKVLPRRALDAKFKFQFESLEQALSDLVPQILAIPAIVLPPALQGLIRKPT